MYKLNNTNKINIFFESNSKFGLKGVTHGNVVAIKEDNRVLKLVWLSEDMITSNKIEYDIRDIKNYTFEIEVLE